MKGYEVGTSDIVKVDDGYAAGYYHFSPSHERVEVVEAYGEDAICIFYDDTPIALAELDSKINNVCTLT